ncbi:MAG: hypothetical protein K0R66_177 [Gammaproteobacteria bacterium]|jgi:hypothetical protein|nr:hypothetical protein [Gammaproteobacteria bacterium]
MEVDHKKRLCSLLAGGMFLSIANAMPGFDKDRDSYSLFTAAGLFCFLLVIADVVYVRRRSAAIQPEAEVEAISDTAATIAASLRQEISMQDLPQHQAAGTNLLFQNQSKQEGPPFSGEPAESRLKRMPESKQVGIALVVSNEPISSATAGMATFSEQSGPQALRVQTMNLGLANGIGRFGAHFDSPTPGRTPISP